MGPMICDIKKLTFSSPLVSILIICVLISTDGFVVPYDSIPSVYAFPTDQQAVVQSVWSLSSSTNSVGNVISDYAGNAFFPQTTQNKLVRLEPATNIVTEWEISSNGSSNAAPTGIAFDPTTGSIYFTESGTDIIGRLEPGRGMITEWEVGSKPQALGVTPAGSVFYIDELGRIARLG
jgi:streptogramin lyase